MSLILKPYWEHLRDFGDSTTPPPAISPERLANPFAQLPPQLELPVEVRSFHDLGDQTQFTGWEYLTRSRASAIRGPTARTHEKRRARFAELKKVTEEMGFQLPADFVTLMETDEYVSRLRIGCQSIQLPEVLCPCPLDPSRVMFQFLIEEQGCDHTHLLLARDGSHCVTRSAFGYGLDPQLAGRPTQEEEQLICLLAESFAEFLCRESDTIREYERGLPDKMVEWGDHARNAGDLQAVLDSYKIARCFDPGNDMIQRRIAELG